MKFLKFCFVFVLLTSLALAGTKLEKLEGSKLQFRCDAAICMVEWQVRVEDKDGNVLYEGHLSDDGVFDYRKYQEKAHRIVVSRGKESIVFLLPHSCCCH